MTWFVPHETYDRTITSPDGEEATVTLRCLNAGDRAEIDDQIKMELVEGEDGEQAGRPDLRLGTMKTMIVQRALVAWSLPQAISPTTLAQLHPDVFNQIFALASFGKPPEPEPEASPTPPPPGPVPAVVPPSAETS